jgi:hypothetical protein
LSASFNDSDRSTIDQRVNLTYDERIISDYAKLARALRADFLPPRVITVINRLYNVFASGISIHTPLFQFVPYDIDVNDVSHWETLLTNALNALIALTNREDILTAYRLQTQLKITFLPMLQLTGLPTYASAEGEDSSKFLRAAKPKFAPEMLDLWGNFTHAGTDAAGNRVVDFDIDNEYGLVYKFAFTKNFSMLDNALTGKYYRPSNGYEPGLLVPCASMVANNTTNMKHVNALGVMADLNSTGYGSYAYGTLSQNGMYCWNQVNRNPVRMPQTSILQTTMHNIFEDSYEIVRYLLSIPENM